MFYKYSKINLLILTAFVVLGLSSCEKDPDMTGDPELTVNAGNDQTLDLGVEVFLQGQASISDGSTLTITWEIIDKPSESNLTLSNPNNLALNFTPDVIGTYSFKLTARNDTGIEGSDEVDITVELATIQLGDITENTTLEDVWEDPTIPDYKVSTKSTVSAELMIEPGVVIAFDQNAYMTIVSTGSIVANGTSDAKIRFTGCQETRGYWRQLDIQSNNPSNALNHVIIEYGGADLQALLVSTGQISVQNCAFQQNANYAIHVQDKDATLPTFQNNTLSNNEKPVLCLLEHFGYWDGTNDFSGNDFDYIQGYQNRHIHNNATWKNLNVPYYLPETVNNVFSDISIAPGADFISASNGGLFVVDEGTLQVIGTSAERITFSGEEPIPGYWKGLSFTTNSTKNELSYVDISHGGSDGFTSEGLKSNVIVEDEGRLKISNSTLRNSAGYGLIVKSDESILSEFSNNVISENQIPVSATPWQFDAFDASTDFTGNEFDHIDGQRHTTLFLEKNATWKKLNVPYILPTRLININSDIELEAGTTFIGRTNAGIVVKADGSLKANGREDEPITFEAEESLPGKWVGIRFESISTQNQLNYVNISDGGQLGFDSSTLGKLIEVVGLLSASNCTISNSLAVGVFVKEDANYTDIDNTYFDNPGGDVIFE